MIEKKVKKIVHKVDPEILKQAHFYVYAICNNPTAKRCYIARELFKKVLTSLTSTEEECVERIHETEDEAKAYFGEEFVERLEEIIQYCDEKNLKLLLHGTSPENVPTILDEGLKSRINDLSYTSIPLNRPIPYSTLLNWPHREYKGIVLLAIPTECLTRYGNEISPIWNGEKSSYHSINYTLSPEFILGGLDIEHKSIIMNDAFSCEHDYSKFRLKNNEIDELDPAITSIDNNDEFDSFHVDDIKWDESQISHDIDTEPITAPIEYFEVPPFQEECISIYYPPHTQEAYNALDILTEILAQWRAEMNSYRIFTIL